MSAFDPLRALASERYGWAMSRQSNLRQEMAQYFRSIGHTPQRASELARAFYESEAKILAEARKVYRPARMDAAGPLDADDAGPWECLIRVDTDERRDAMLADQALMQRLNDAASAGGWPAIMGIESQETVDRSYEGSWFNRSRA